MNPSDPFWRSVASFGLTEVALPGDPGDEPSGSARAGVSSLEALRDQTDGCTRCRLAGGRKRLVFGEGNPDSGILFVGEGPGATEDETGLPFVGRAGELLNRILASVSLDRNSVFIANVVKCRPPGNRTPAPDEVGACLEILMKQVEIIRPEIIVALGASAAGALLGTRRGIGALRGSIHRFMGIDVMVTYHPAALLRSPALKRPVWEDMKKLQIIMGEKGLPRSASVVG